MEMRLADYKVRVINGRDGTAARVRVVIESQDDDTVWGTVGVSENVIEASWLALIDAFVNTSSTRMPGPRIPPVALAQNLNKIASREELFMNAATEPTLASVVNDEYTRYLRHLAARWNVPYVACRRRKPGSSRSRSATASATSSFT